MFLNTPYVFTVAGREREEIIRLLPRADAVAEVSIWDLGNLRHHVVRVRDNLTTKQGMRNWLATVAGLTWMVRILVVNRPIHSHNRTRSPITRGRRRPYHALGRTLLDVAQQQPS